MIAPYVKPKVSRLARRMFAPVLAAGGPAKLDLEDVDDRAALVAIADLGDLVRVCDDDPNPLRCSYVLTSGAVLAFLSPWRRVLLRLGWRA